MHSPRTLLSARSAISIVVGLVIGVGIFKTPAIVAGLTQDAGWFVLVWLLGGVLSLAGALCYAELCTAFPHSGGEYHFLSRAYGRSLAFLYAWAKAMVINTGAIALLAFVFGDYMTSLYPLGEHSSAIWAALVVVALTASNLAGLAASSRVQMWLTALEVLGLVSVAVAGLWLGGHSGGSLAYFSQSPSLGMLGLALVFVLLTYGGWSEAAYITSEVHGGPRQTVRVLIVSLLIILVVYLLVTYALLLGLGLHGLSNSRAAGVEVMGLAFGEWAARLLGLMVAISALTSINATMIVGARTNHALGQDWSALGRLGEWKTESGTPSQALIFQGVISLALVGFGALQSDGFSAMVEFTAPVFWAFLFLVGLSVFVLRLRKPHQHRPFQVPLYPLTPLVFCASSAYLTHSSISYAASQDAVGVSLGVLALGVIVLVGIRLAQRQA